jgi:hypothetical protein
LIRKNVGAPTFVMATLATPQRPSTRKDVSSPQGPLVSLSGLVLPHPPELFVWLKQKWADLFQADFEVVLYDLTSSYFEGEMEGNPQAKRGYSRDGQPDCQQVIEIAIRRQTPELTQQAVWEKLATISND